MKIRTFRPPHFLRRPLAALNAVFLSFAPIADVDADSASEFSDTIELSEFSVQGEDLSISIYARSKSDRRYAERFADSVVELAYETIEKSTGHGLVIVGDQGEPHPVFVVQKFLEMAKNGQLENDFSEAVIEIEEKMKSWETASLNFEQDDSNQVNIGFEQIVNAIPLPLEGIGPKLYMLAWEERFDEESVEERLRTLDHDELQSEELSKYDWVFYLPPKNAFDKVLKEIRPQIMKEAKLGFFKRTAIRGALVILKPLIRDAVESFRKGMLFETVLRGMSDYNKGDREAISRAYIEAMMPHGKVFSSDKRERAREAIAAQKIKNIEYSKDPYIKPKRLENFDINAYSKFVGEYGSKGNPVRRFSIEGGACYWQYKENNPIAVFPTSDNTVVTEDGKKTFGFRAGEEGGITGVEVREERNRFTLPIRTANSQPE